MNDNKDIQKENFNGVEEVNELNCHYISKKTNLNKKLTLNNFKDKSNHYYIMTDGGLPIYSRYGDEIDNSCILSSFSAIISKYERIDNKNIQELETIKSDNLNFYITKKGNIYLIAIIKNISTNYNFKNSINSTYVHDRRIKSSLDLLYNQLVSIITADRIPFIEKKPSSCYEAMSGTETLFEQTISYSHSNLPCMINSYEVLIIDGQSRVKLKSILKKNIGDSLLSICLTKQGIISYEINLKVIQLLHYSDVLLIYNLIQASECLSLTESWVPICLPGISDRGYLQLYCNFFKVEGNIDVGLVYVTESQSGDMFMSFSEQANSVINSCIENNIIKVTANINNDNNDSNINSGNITESNSDIKKNIYSKLHNSYIYRRKKCSRSLNNSNEDYLNDDRLLEDFIHKLSYNFDKIETHKDIFDKVEYLICRHKTLNQSFTVGFEDYDIDLKKDEKYVKSVFYDLYNNYLNSNDKTFNINNNSSSNHSYFVAELNRNISNYVSLIEADNYVIIASFSIFKDVEDIYATMNELVKHIKIYINQYFIL